MIATLAAPESSPARHVAVSSGDCGPKFGTTSRAGVTSFAGVEARDDVAGGADHLRAPPSSTQVRTVSRASPWTCIEVAAGHHHLRGRPERRPAQAASDSARAESSGRTHRPTPPRAAGAPASRQRGEELGAAGGGRRGRAHLDGPNPRISSGSAASSSAMSRVAGVKAGLGGVHVALVLGDQRPLHPPLGGVAEDDRTACRAAP